jgi:hypothetical protein
VVGVRVGSWKGSKRERDRGTGEGIGRGGCDCVTILAKKFGLLE